MSAPKSHRQGPRRRGPWAWIAVAAVLTAAVAAAIVLRRAAPASLAPPPSQQGAAGRVLPQATYAGSQRCAECHEQEASAWRASQHAGAMAEATPATVRGRFDGQRIRYAGIESQFHQKDGTYYVRTDGPDRRLHDYAVKYTFGLDPLQQYLVEFPGGRLQALPFAWDARPAAEGGQRWFHLYPDERITAGDPLHWTGINQNWNFMCADCHSTNLRKGYDRQARTFDTTWSEISVGCEACHGPGSEHIAWARQPKTSRDGAGPRLTAPLAAVSAWHVDPATGQPVRSVPRAGDTEIEVCARCHARRSQITDDARAGDPFLDAFRPVSIEPGLYYPDGQQRDEVYTYGSFLQSRMYAQGVTCSDCHEPHGAALRAEGNALCTRCHVPARYDTPSHHEHPAGTEAARCVTCHMPAATFMQIDRRRDHSFRVPRPDRAVALGVPDVCTSACHAGKSPAWAAAAIATRTGRDPGGFQRFAEAFAAGERGDAAAPSLLNGIAADSSESPIARASALGRLAAIGTLPAASVLSRSLTDPSALVRRAAVASLQGADPALRLQLLPPLLNDPVRAVRTQAVPLLADVADAGLSADVRRAFGRAYDEYVAEQRFNADRPDAQTALGTVYGLRGRFDQARTAFEEAIRLDPRHVPAYVNLADLYRANQDEAGADRVLRRALQENPGAADAHHALGLSLVRQHRSAEALPELHEAARLAPGNPRYAYVEGVALHDTGRTAAALSALEAAHRRHPSDRDILMALALYAREAGRNADAREYARKLVALDPGNQDARALLAEIER